MSTCLTCSVRAAGPVLLALQAAGIDLGLVTQRLDIPPESLLDADARFPVAKLMLPLWNLAEEMLGDPVVALRATEHLSRESFGVFSYIVAASATAGEAVARAIRYFRLITDGGSYSLERQATDVWWRFTPANAAVAACRHDTVFALAAAVKHLRLWAEPHFVPREIRFSCAELPGRGEIERFFGASIALGSDRCAFRFDAELLNRSSGLADPQLARFLEGYADDAVAALPVLGSVSSRVRGLLARGLKDGDTSVEVIARRLSLSERSLQRELQKERTSLSRLVDELRCEMATRYLRQRELSISDVAYMLGFSQTAPFFRAFKRWTGLTPGDFRRAFHSAE